MTQGAKIRRLHEGNRDVPLYEMVDSLIRKRLVENFWNAGDILPSEIQLALEFEVSQGTVRRAMDGLVAEGLVVRRQGLGTYVSDMEDRRSLFLFFNMVGHDGRQEMPAARLLDSQSGTASELEAKKLQILVGAPVRRLQRLRLFREVPVIIERVVVSDSFIPNLGKDSTPPDHLFRHYETDYKVTVVDGEEYVRAVAATPEEANLLQVASGSALLEIDRVAFTLQHRPVEWRLSRCDMSKHDYRVDRG